MAPFSTQVSRDDAVAFCASEGKRLPRPWEIQRAATGNVTGRPYPWGETWVEAAAPPRDSGPHRMKPPPNVGSHPAGASPEGVMDLSATIWHLSDRYCDLHTCRTILTGGSTYHPRGSCWYFPQAYQNHEHNTLLNFNDGLDRSAAIGFRCVADP